jgi:hypothetical protein
MKNHEQNTNTNRYEKNGEELVEEYVTRMLGDALDMLRPILVYFTVFVFSIFLTMFLLSLFN